jgi:glycerol uptake facilitator-like aquaporin
MSAMPAATLGRRLAAEALGTALLLAIVVGSGVMGERLAGGNVAVALLANTLATGAGLMALILALGGWSAHFNPLVSALAASRGGLPWREVPPYIAVQVVGAISGVLLAHAMFDLPLIETSRHVRAGTGQLVSEFVATVGLLAVILGTGRHRPAAVPYAVAAWVTAGYWFTASTCFANPAVAIARSLTDTFSGIRPADVPGFIAAEIVGTLAAGLVFRWLLMPSGEPASATPGPAAHPALPSLPGIPEKP